MTTALLSISSGPVVEGGVITGALTLSAPTTAAATGLVTITTTGPLGPTSQNFSIVLLAGQTTFNFSGRVYDDSRTGDGSYQVTAFFSLDGGATTVTPTGLLGAVTNNDNSAFSINVQPDTVFSNIARLSPISFDAFTALVELGRQAHTDRQIVQGLEPTLLATSSVAVLSYQFFTGLTPSLAGMDFLLKPTVNPNSLNSAYYTDFNLENRYINFAANLGLEGEGAAAFKTAYGSLSLNDAIAKAYAEIVGPRSTTFDTAAAIASIQSSDSYFQQVAHERLGAANQDLAAKAVAIGYILEEAARANLGVYAHALENLYLDLADGTAQSHVNLVGVYGVGTFVDLLG